MARAPDRRRSGPGVDDGERALGGADQAAVVVDRAPHDGAAVGHGQDNGFGLQDAGLDRGDVVEFDLGGGGPLAGFHERVHDDAGDVVDDGGQDAAVDVAERGQEFLGDGGPAAEFAGFE